MALSFKFKFMRALKRHQPQTRFQVTQRMLVKMKKPSMEGLTRLIRMLLKLEFIKIETIESGKSGKNPDSFTVTDKGSDWVAEKEEK